MSENNKWVTQKELATELNLTQGAIQNWIQRGVIKWKMVHGVRVVDKTSLKPAKRGRPVVNKK